MCFSAGTLLAMQAGSSILQGSMAKSSANAQAQQIDYEASTERDAAQAQAAKILRATRRERGAARAALAASGTALDDFALRNEQDIQELGESDAAMTILTGERRGRMMNAQADQTRQAGRNSLTASLLRAGGQFANGWKGTKDPVGDFYLRGTVGSGG